MSKISVIVPVYNAEKSIVRCLDSIKSQTYSDFEAILVNDGSKDSSKSICEEYCRKDNRFRLINQENAGPSKARNRGIDEAKSEYLAFVDSDDYIEPDMLEKLFEGAKSFGADLVVCGYYKENERGNMRAYSSKYEPGVYTGEELEKIAVDSIDVGVSENIPPYSGIRLVKKSCMENPSLRFNTDIYRSEDYLIWNILFSRIRCLCLITDRPLYHYIVNETSITHSYVKNYWEMSKVIYDELKKIIPENDNVTKRLNLMFLRRACMSLTIASKAEDKKTFRYDMKKVLSDRDLRNAIKDIPFKVGFKREKMRYILFKFRLYFVIRMLFYFKFFKS